MDNALGPIGVSGSRKNRARFVYRRDSGFVLLHMQMHALAKTKLATAKKRKVIPNGGFLSALLAPLAILVLLPLLRQVLQ